MPRVFRSMYADACNYLQVKDITRLACLSREWDNLVRTGQFSVATLNLGPRTNLERVRRFVRSDQHNQLRSLTVENVDLPAFVPTERVKTLTIRDRGAGSVSRKAGSIACPDLEELKLISMHQPDHLFAIVAPGLRRLDINIVGMPEPQQALRLPSLSFPRLREFKLSGFFIYVSAATLGALWRACPELTTFEIVGTRIGHTGTHDLAAWLSSAPSALTRLCLMPGVYQPAIAAPDLFVLHLMIAASHKPMVGLELRAIGALSTNQIVGAMMTWTKTLKCLRVPGTTDHSMSTVLRQTAHLCPGMELFSVGAEHQPRNGAVTAREVEAWLQTHPCVRDMGIVHVQADTTASMHRLLAHRVARSIRVVHKSFRQLTDGFLHADAVSLPSTAKPRVHFAEAWTAFDFRALRRVSGSLVSRLSELSLTVTPSVIDANMATLLLCADRLDTITLRQGGDSRSMQIGIDTVRALLQHPTLQVIHMDPHQPLPPAVTLSDVIELVLLHRKRPDPRFRFDARFNVTDESFCKTHGALTIKYELGRLCVWPK